MDAHLRTHHYETMDLALRIGEALLASGMGAEKVTHTIRNVLATYGLGDCSVDVTFAAITMSWQPAPYEPPETYARTVAVRTQDFTRLTAVSELVSDICYHGTTVPQGQARMRKIDAAAHPYRPKFAALAWGGLAAAVSVLLGGAALIAAVAFVTAVVIYLVNRTLHRHDVSIFFQQVAGALIATGAAVVLRATDVAVAPSLVIATGIVILLAGLTFTGAIEDALTGYYLTAAARLLEVAVLTGAIVAGVVIGLQVGAHFDIRFTTHMRVYAPERIPLLLAAAAATAACFAYASYAPRRVLLPAAAAGAMGEGVFVLMRVYGFGAPWSAGVAACCIGFGAYIVAGRLRIPPQITIAAGIIPLVPGLAIYRGLFTIMDTGTMVGFGQLVTAVTTAVALAGGALIGERLAAPVRHQLRRWERMLSLSSTWYRTHRLTLPKRRRWWRP